MKNNNRNKENLFEDADDKRNRNENRPAEENEGSTNPDESVPDLDGDGLIGNTGGFYGGTSYIGSNYSEDWNRNEDVNQNKGNFGAAGHSDPSDDERGRTDEDDDDNDNGPHITRDDRII